MRTAGHLTQWEAFKLGNISMLRSRDVFSLYHILQGTKHDKSIDYRLFHPNQS